MVPGMYLTEFKKAADSLDKELLAQKKLEVETGAWLESIVLRLQKNAWANKPNEKPQSDAAIFFSIWVSDKAVKDGKIFYNIHALKLRQLKGHKITSREFANAFRKRFKPFEHHWPNVSVNFGPLTLMEGWEKLNTVTIATDVSRIASRFFEIDSLIDELLIHYRQ